MGNNLLTALYIVSCYIPGHLGIANHIDPWFYDVIGLHLCLKNFLGDIDITPTTSWVISISPAVWGNIIDDLLMLTTWAISGETR